MTTSWNNRRKSTHWVEQPCSPSRIVEVDSRPNIQNEVADVVQRSRSARWRRGSPFTPIVEYRRSVGRGPLRGSSSRPVPATVTAGPRPPSVDFGDPLWRTAWPLRIKVTSNPGDRRRHRHRNSWVRAETAQLLGRARRGEDRRRNGNLSSRSREATRSARTPSRFDRCSRHHDRGHLKVTAYDLHARSTS